MANLVIAFGYCCPLLVHTLYLFVTCGNVLVSQRTNSKLIVVYVLIVNYAFHGFGQV